MWAAQEGHLGVDLQLVNQEANINALSSETEEFDDEDNEKMILIFYELVMSRRRKWLNQKNFFEDLFDEEY